MLTGALGGPPGPDGAVWGALGNPVGGGGGGLLCQENKKKKSLTKSVCLTSSFSLPTPEHKTLQAACHYTQCGSIFLILLHITPYLTSRCFYAS